MKIAVVGAGGVGAACLMSLIIGQVATEIVVVDINEKRLAGIVTDMQYGAGMHGQTRIVAGDYADLANAQVVLITAGVNEKTGGATDRNDPLGRLRLLAVNAKIFEDIVPKIVKSNPNITIVVVSDPPDALAEVARKFAGKTRVLSAGTFLDSMRFRWHIANHFKINPAGVNAYVIGEHGTSSVFLWSSATIGGVPLENLLKKTNTSLDALRQEIENAVRFANITIIEGINASQYGIGMVSAQIAKIILLDENIVVPIGSYYSKLGVTLTLPSVLGKAGVTQVFDQGLSASEQAGLEKSADAIKNAVKSLG